MDLDDILTRAFFFAVVLSMPLLLIGVPYLYLTGRLERFGRRPLEARFKGLDLRTSPGPGDVELVYHTYCGLLLWVTQTEHRVYAPPDDARALLGRLLRYNLTWGLLSYGLLLIPPISYANYVIQKRSIARQRDALATVDATVNATVDAAVFEGSTDLTSSVPDAGRE